MNDARHIHISARRKPFDLNLGELWEYRDLVLLFTRRTFTVSYKQTILGPLWLFINPLLTSIVYVVLFGNIARLSTDGVPQLLFYFSGTALWNYFSSAVSRNSSTFTGNAYLFGKVYFPRLVIPASNLLSGMVQLGIQFVPVFLLMLYYGLIGAIRPQWGCWALIPLAVLLLGLMGLGVGIIISSLTTKYRDLNVLVGFGLSLWMYASPVVYPLSSVSGWVRSVLLLNPVTGPLELLRHALFGSGHILWNQLLYALLFTVAVDTVGLAVFNRVERTFVDTV